MICAWHTMHCLTIPMSIWPPPQWHPYGEFFASGSVDTNLKIWDLRRRTCIQTYKGHARGVRQIIFSPDGRWVVSGGDDGVVKLWDLTMGKCVSGSLAQLTPQRSCVVLLCADTPGDCTCARLHIPECLLVPPCL